MKHEKSTTSQSASQLEDQSSSECPAIPKQNTEARRRNECQHPIESTRTNFELDLEPSTSKYITPWQISPVPKIKTNLIT